MCYRDNIYDAIRFLEKLLLEKRKKVEDAERMFRNLSPHKWQLILTTGDLDTQKTLGPQIKYKIYISNFLQLNVNIDALRIL